MTIILLAALIPPIFLMVKIYKMDKIEREPMGLILKLLFFGALVTIAASYGETFLAAILSALTPENSLAYLLIENFLIVAWMEEGVKHFVLKRCTWRHPAFDYRFDAVVYAVAASLGFAALENIFYVAEYGLSVAATRAVLSIPGHCIFGIFMGYYYGAAKMFALRGNAGRARRYDRLSLFIPILLHGFYDFAASMDGDLWNYLFLGFIVFMEIFAFLEIRKFQKADGRLAEHHIDNLSGE